MTASDGVYTTPAEKVRIPQGPAARLGTRETLLRTAAVVFSRKGFQQATIREIVTTAGASLCLVNYHFGDKLGLYREVMYHLAAVVEQRYPLLHETPGLTPRQQLLEFVDHFLRRMYDDIDGAQLGALIAREMMQPTIVMSEVTVEIGRYHFKRLCEILAACQADGHLAGSAMIHRVALGVYGQCWFYGTCHLGMEHLGESAPVMPADLGWLARDIARAALAARSELAQPEPEEA